MKAQAEKRLVRPSNYLSSDVGSFLSHSLASILQFSQTLSSQPEMTMSSSKGQSYVGSSEAHLSHTSFTWTIDKFSYRTPSPYAVSPVFSDEEKDEFKLRLYDSDGFLCLNIIPTRLTKYSLDIKYKLQLDASVGFQPISFGKV